MAGKGHFEKDLQKMNTKTVKKRQTKGHSVWLATRVTRCASEKIAQIEAQPVFFVKIYAQLLPWKKVACTYERFKITTHSKQ
jgi:hypothetical protein